MWHLRSLVSVTVLHTLGSLTLKYAVRRHLSVPRCMYSTAISKPLRILFCGSDHFSSASLKAVHAEQLRDPKSIASIEVLARPGKLSGRGLKFIREVPIISVARELGLPLHERDTFTGWNLPQPDGELINLIIAVSFGLKVPPRVLKSAEYGGINVHPSLLPDFRGPAPLYHVLLAGETHTGVTLQTLHPEKFDHGTILAQTSPLEIPNASKCTYQELLDFITPKASDLLVQGIRDRLFVSNLPSSAPPSPEGGRPLRHAPKITTEDRHIHWREWRTEDLLRRDRVLGRLWSASQPAGKAKMRIIFDGFEDMTSKAPECWWFEPLNKIAEIANSQAAGKISEIGDLGEIEKFFVLPFVSADNEPVNIFCVKHDDHAIVMRLPNCDLLLVRDITVESDRKKPAAKALTEWFKTAQIGGSSIM